MDKQKSAQPVLQMLLYYQAIHEYAANFYEDKSSIYLCIFLLYAQPAPISTFLRWRDQIPRDGGSA